MEAQDDPGKEGGLGEDPLARPDETKEAADSQASERGEIRSTDDEFVEEMESDPARAGTDSPAEDLQGG